MSCERLLLRSPSSSAVELLKVIKIDPINATKIIKDIRTNGPECSLNIHKPMDSMFELNESILRLLIPSKLNIKKVIREERKNPRTNEKKKK